jgi:TRAP-type C4-dicarboxylate transport system permease small subunit
MVLVASAQALFFNIAERDVAWARALLEQLSWADAFLQKGTLWLAFLGASLATHEDKHIAIDVLPKLVSERRAAALRVFASLGASVISFVLAGVFYQACLVADAAVPFDYEVITKDGPAHVCDVAASQLGSTSRPSVLCALRGALAAVGVHVSGGGGIAQLIAPLMFVLIGVRLLARSLSVALKLFGGGGDADGNDMVGGGSDQAASEADE